MAGVYVHLPFCPYICPYCDFAKWPHKRSAAARYMGALLHEASAASASLRASGYGPFETVYFGGGTPNTYAAVEIATLLARLRELFPGEDARETTIEVNPELVDLEDLHAYAAAGINRVSIGVQSFDESEARTLGRKHSARDVERAVTGARDAGIASVSLDLMFAVPGQTAASWERSLKTAIGMGVDHVSTYGLTVEADTPYETWQAREPGAFASQDLEAELYGIAIDTLERAGFEHYEISNFARPGHRSAHNANYWANGDYIGLGVGAASYLGGVRSVHTKSLDAYINAALEGGPIPAESEALHGDARAGEAIMLALRTSQGVSLRQFKQRYGVDVLQKYSPVVERFRAEGLVEIDDARMRLTRRGRFLANDVCAAFVIPA